MSNNYTKSNNESSRDLFEKRNAFKVSMAKSGEPVVDLNFGEKYFYGRVDRNFIPIVLRLQSLSDFNSSLSEGAVTSDANFVVRAFYDLSEQFKKCAMAQKIAGSDPYLTNLRIYNAYENHEKAYLSYWEEFSNAIKSEFFSQNIRPHNFEHFIEHFLRIYQDNFMLQPITKTAFIKSGKCPPRVSGLTIDIADIDPADDVKKIEFISGPNWPFFKNACRSYGFMIDANVPYRLVADLGSPVMIKYAQEYGLNSTDSILRNAYEYVHDEYFPKFRYYMLQLYQQIRPSSFLETSACDDYGFKTQSEVIEPTKYTLETFDREFDEVYFLNLYTHLRILETANSGLTATEEALLIDDCSELYHGSDLTYTLQIFEFIMNKPFDYSGSLSYIYTHLDAVKRAMDEALGKSNPRAATSQGQMDGGY